MSVDGAAPVRAKIKEIVPEYTFPDDKAKHDSVDLLAECRFRAVAGHDVYGPTRS